MGSDASRPFRFGVVLTGGEPAGWAERSRRAEALGYDVVLAPDHLGLPAPLPSLGAAAAVTARARVGTFVLNTAFYDPGLLAREVATIDGVSGGRFELGLGAGYVRSEFDALGIPFGTASERLDRLERFLERLDGFLADPDLRPRPDQRPVPIFLGGNGNRMLRIAVQHAGIVGFSGTTVDADGRLTLIGGDDFADRVGYARAAAGARADEIEWNALVQVVAITDDREEAGERLRESWAPHLAIDEFLAAPTVLVGTVDEMAADLEERRQRLGLTYVSVLEPAMEDFALVVERLNNKR